MSWIKNWVKYHFSKQIHSAKLHPLVGIQQRALMQHYLVAQTNKQVPDFRTTGYKVFSQFEEDGLLLFLFSLIGEGSKTFIEIGANDGINSNCSNLTIHFGWSGLFFEGNPKLIKRGEKFYSRIPTPYHPKPQFIQAIIKRENINQLIEKTGLSGEIELLSIDIDGNDYWIWDALTIVQPKVVVIETHTEFGNENIVVPYDPEYIYPGKHPVYHGASVVAMNKLAEKKGYRLVGANDMGINQIYLRKDLLLDELPTITPESTLWHPKAKAGQAAFSEIKNWKYLKG
ncbi:hypothetical protein [Fluviicola sp.]|jgi:hypothetical protein|uniref:hypothetical protein n=1 Tax=Fluviicola sp. TaxID=1917219 RepID=UPI002820047B|nr:hypothetical protein [Fluviicola sp.]MDR0800974.1 hypothetical protein [Fluviicola sp.]